MRRLPDGSLLVSIPPHYQLDWTIYEIYGVGVYEHDQPLVRGMTVLDVGASIGVFTLKASRIVGPSGKVIAVEPDPESFQALKNNLAANNIMNVDAVNVAAWNTYGTLELNVSVKPTSRFVVKPEAQLIRVQAMPLDEVLNSLHVSVLDFIKMDVEGAALEVLQGLSKSLLHTRHIAIAAYHKRENVAEIASFLEDKGFKVAVWRWFLLFPYVYAVRTS